MVSQKNKGTEHPVREQVLGYKAPARAYQAENADPRCPFTGSLVVKQETLQGVVVRKDVNKTATVEWQRSQFIPKYERYALQRSRVRVHNPPALDAQIGDEVVIARTRPLSKMKHHVVIAIVKRAGQKTSGGTTRGTNDDNGGKA